MLKYTIKLPGVMKKRNKIRNDVRMARQKRGLAVEKVKNKFFISWQESESRGKIYTAIAHILVD